MIDPSEMNSSPKKPMLRRRSRERPVPLDCEAVVVAIRSSGVRPITAKYTVPLRSRTQTHGAGWARAGFPQSHRRPRADAEPDRSEERRVGKEGRPRRSPGHHTKAAYA